MKKKKAWLVIDLMLTLDSRLTWAQIDQGGEPRGFKPSDIWRLKKCVNLGDRPWAQRKKNLSLVTIA